MLARIRKSMQERDQGFTLIELLVVMIIIGILAAIAIPVFLNQRAKARETSAKSDVTTIGKEIAAFYVDGTGDLTVENKTTSAGTDPDVVTTEAEWVIKKGTTEIASGPLTKNGSVVNVAEGTASSVDDFCVEVVSGTGTADEEKDLPQSYDETGLKPGVGCP